MKTIKKLQLITCIVLLPSVLFAVGCETDCLPDFVGIIDEPSYLLQIMACIYTLVLVPMSMKWLYFKRVQTSIREAGESRYFSHSIIALMACCCPIEVGIFLYYLMLDTSMLFCALIAMVGLVILWPTQSKMDSYLERLAPEERTDKEGRA